MTRDLGITARPGERHYIDLAGMEEIAKFKFLTGTTVANQDRLPTWKPGDEFLPARIKSGVE